MAAGQGFPRSLLERPALERRRYFRDYTIAHPHLVEVYQQLRDELTTTDRGSLIFVCGPSGIGKTTLLGRIEQKFLEEMRPELEQDPCRLPLVTIEALSPETGNFNWKDFYRRLLARLGEPCIDKKSFLIYSVMIVRITDTLPCTGKPVSRNYATPRSRL